MLPLLNVRRAALSDESALFALASQFPAPTPRVRETFGETLRRRLKDADAFVAVAEVDGTLVGYVAGDAHETFYAGGKVAWVDEIFVIEEARREAQRSRIDDGVRGAGQGFRVCPYRSRHTRRRTVL